MLPLQRTRSRHDCNFIPGSPFLNAGNFLLHQIFPLKTFCFNRYHSFSSFLLLHDVVVEVAELSQRIFFEQSTMKQKFEISVTKLQKVRTSHSFSVEPANIRRPLKAEKSLPSSFAQKSQKRNNACQTEMQKYLASTSSDSMDQNPLVDTLEEVSSSQDSTNQIRIVENLEQQPERQFQIPAVKTIMVPQYTKP